MGRSITLAIETSDVRGGVALLDGETLLAERLFGGDLRHDRELMPAIAALLGGASIRPEDVDLVAVGTGPGSYTGLRIGIAAAKAFAFATGAAALGIPSFDALVAGLDDAARAGLGEVVAVADARRGAVYVQRYAADRLDAVGPLAIARPADALEGASRPVLVVGPGLRVAAVRSALAADAVAFAAEHLWAPDPKALGRIARRRREAGLAMAPRDVEPLYLRLSAAEEKIGAEGSP